LGAMRGRTDDIESIEMLVTAQSSNQTSHIPVSFYPKTRQIELHGKLEPGKYDYEIKITLKDGRVVSSKEDKGYFNLDPCPPTGDIIPNPPDSGDGTGQPPEEPDVIRIRFTCNVTKEEMEGIIYISLKSGTVQVDEDGNPLYGVSPGGAQGSISRSCASLEDTVPQCIDPRTGTPTDEPLDFIKEFSRDLPKETITKEHDELFWTMTGGERSCRSDELPME